MRPKESTSTSALVFVRRRGFGFYCSGLSSLFGGYDTLCSEIFGDGKFR